jgi:hypothetical protein
MDEQDAIKEMLLWRQVEAGDVMLPFVAVDGDAWYSTRDLAFITAFGGVTLYDFIVHSHFSLTHDITEVHHG